MEENNNLNVSGEMNMPKRPLIETHHSHVGPVLGVLIIILILVLAGLYLWGGMLSKQEAELEQQQIINNEPETPRADADVRTLNTLSPSDELEAIEADLDGTNLDSIDQDFSAIDAELNPAP